MNNRHGTTYKIIEAVPFFGKAGTTTIDFTQAAIAQHGVVVGSVKGLLVGLVVAMVMITSVEAATAVFDVVREEVRLRWTNGMIADRREAAEERSNEDDRRRRMHVGARDERIGPAVHYYAIDTGGHAPKIDGKLTPNKTLDYLHKWRSPKLASSVPMTPVAGTGIKPFFYNVDGRVARLSIPKKGECVFASLGENIILIPWSEYRKAGLPLKGDVRNDEE